MGASGSALQYPTPLPATTDRVVLLYGFGSTQPTLIIPENESITNSTICESFNESFDQNIYILCSSTLSLIHTFTGLLPSRVTIPFGPYFVVFQYVVDDFGDLGSIKNHLITMKEMMKFETNRGDLRNSLIYPNVASLLQNVECFTNPMIAFNKPVPAYYKVGAIKPTVQGLTEAQKLELCIIFGQSIYQNVKIFYETSYFVTLYNCFETIDICNPGKYVIVFKTDAIYTMSNHEIENELKKIEAELEVESKKQCSPADSGKEIYLYGFGDLTPTQILSKNGKITKKYICSLFDEPIGQEIHVFHGSSYIHCLHKHDETCSIFLDYGSYTFVFQKDIEVENLKRIKDLLTLKAEMEKFETQKGDLRCEKTYPQISSLLQSAEKISKTWDDCPRAYVTGFYGVGQSLPQLQGGQGSAMKIVLCAIFNQSIYQEVKVFYNNRLYARVSNCFISVYTHLPGKYVVVFESDAISRMPISPAENELRGIEKQLLLEKELKQKILVEEEQKKKSQEKTEKKTATVSTSRSKDKVYIYGYGYLEPQFFLNPNTLIDKYILCIVFGKRHDQEVHILCKNVLLRTFPADENGTYRLEKADHYIIVFEDEVKLENSLETIVRHIIIMNEMRLCEEKKGTIRSPRYPHTYDLFQKIEYLSATIAAIPNFPVPSIYGVGAMKPTVTYLPIVTKLVVCMYFKQSIHQDIKIFHNCCHYATLTNCVTRLDLPMIGKCVAVFNTDSIYHMRTDEIEDELRRIEAKMAGNMEEEKLRKAVKNNQKKTKKKGKKKQQNLKKGLNKDIASSSKNLGQSLAGDSTLTPHQTADEIGTDLLAKDEVKKNHTIKKKKGKVKNKPSEKSSAGDTLKQAQESVPDSDFEELVPVEENRFDLLKPGQKTLAVAGSSDETLDACPKDGPAAYQDECIPLGNDILKIGENEVNELHEVGDEELLQRVLADSVPFEKPKVYAKNRNKPFTYEPAIKIEEKQSESVNWKAGACQKSLSADFRPFTSCPSDGDETTCSHSSACSPESGYTEVDTIFEEIPVSQADDSPDGAKAVVVGIHPKGLIVQTLPLIEAESEFLLLDYCSQCTTSGRSLTDVDFDVKVLHVYLKVISVAALGNDAIVNENLTQKGRQIEKRIATYALDGDTWTRGRFKRGRRDSIDEELKLKKKERKIIALIVETDEEDKADIVRVVGPPSHLSFLAQLDKTRMRDEYSPLTQNIYFKKEEFIMADSFQADPFFKLHIMFDTLCLVKSYQSEENFNHLARKMENMYMELQKCLRVEEADVDSILLKNFPHSSDPPTGDTFLFNIQKLTKKDKDQIRTCCKEMAIQEKKEKKKERKRKQKKNKKDPEETEEFDPEEQYNIFRLYIRDPALSICRFNSYAALKSSQLYTIRARARLIVDKGELRLLIILDNDQVNQVLHPDKRIDVKNIWVEGSQLKIFNPVLEREKQTRFGLFVKSDAYVVIDEIQIQRGQVPSVGKNGQPVIVESKRARVTLRPAKNSKDIFSIIQEFHADFYKEFSQIGPAARDGASEALASGLLKFNVFYGHPRFFNWWRGFPDGSENVDYLQNMQERIEIPNGQNTREPFRLDSSQSAAYQHAYHREGITSIAAGPGSGKTLLSGGLICQCQRDRVEERMIVTASTNQGVDNAVQKIAKLSPGFPISREMSKKGEDAVDEELRQYCLQYQSLESEQTNPVLLRVRKEYRKVLAYYEKARTLRQKLNRLELLHFAESKVKRTYLRTIAPFCAASTPALLVRHADHYCWVIEDQDNMKHRHWPMKHLVVDEASQLPYYTSLALCCSYPNLERITVMGDRMQLGPHCVLQNTEGLLSDLCRLSELDRINGLRTVEEFSLRMNYRSHNWIVENFEQPHYGNTFISGLRPEARMLAYNLDLPLFKIRSKNTAKPVAFIDINSGEDCHNASERAGVLRLLELLMEKGANPTGISILCFHRKQKEEMEKCLKPSNFQKLKMSNFVLKIDGVYTIDSFQGRENDIIIVCTTKTVGIEGKYYPGLFKFVADPRRGLVAVSRAKEAMYIFGQWKYLQKTSFWKDKVALMKRENLLYDQNFEVV